MIKFQNTIQVDADTKLFAVFCLLALMFSIDLVLVPTACFSYVGVCVEHSSTSRFCYDLKKGK